MRNEVTNLSVVVKFIFFLLQHKKEYMVRWWNGGRRGLPKSNFTGTLSADGRRRKRNSRNYFSSVFRKMENECISVFLVSKSFTMKLMQVSLC